MEEYLVSQKRTLSIKAESKDDAIEKSKIEPYNKWDVEEPEVEAE
jgi:hypothetical protein